MKVCFFKIFPHNLTFFKYDAHSLFYKLGASVWKFSAEVDGRKIQGVVKEVVEAEADYDEAIRSGQSVFMMQEKPSNIFMVSSFHYFKNCFRINMYFFYFL